MAVLGQAGAGKRTLIGNILYQLRVDMRMLQQLEAHTQRRYVDVVTYFEQNNLGKSFETPSGDVHIIDANNDNDIASADIALWVVNGASSDRGLSSSSELQSLIQRGAINSKRQLLIIAVNQMDAVGWHEGIFKEVEENFKLDIEPAIHVVPISAWCGINNILDPPEEASWAEICKTLIKVIG